MAKILVAENSNAELKVIVDIFKETSHEIITAADGDEAARKARTESVDIVILDTHLPQKNGFQVCRELRSDKQIGDVPIIMVCSEDQKSDQAWGLKQGASEYLLKPFTPLDLLLAIKKYLKKN